MFAVVILGIGFIMIAAIFPVAIRQNAQSAEESVAVTAAQRAVQAIQAQASTTLLHRTAFHPADPINASPVAVNGTPVGPPLQTPAFLFPYPPLLTLGEAYTDAQAEVVTGSTDAVRQWVALRGNLIASTDARLGFAVAYGRAPELSYTMGTTSTADDVTLEPEAARLVVVVGQSRVRSVFNDEDASGVAAKVAKDLRNPRSPAVNYDDYDTQFVSRASASNTPATLQLKRLEARFYLGLDGAADRIRFNNATYTTGDVSAVAEGTFVIVADAAESRRTSVTGPQVTRLFGATTTDRNAAANGRVFRVGRPLPAPGSDTGTWFELIPGQDLQALTPPGTPPNTTVDPRPPFETDVSQVAFTPTQVLVLGRSLQDPLQPFDATTNPYTGNAMDIAVYTTVIGLRR